jgi:hypothetical protein
LEKTKSDEKW